MVDIQCAATEIRQGKKDRRQIEERKKRQDENIIACPSPQGGHKYYIIQTVTTSSVSLVLVNKLTPQLSV